MTPASLPDVAGLLPFRVQADGVDGAPTGSTPRWSLS
jgi:hypothetical protein